MGTRGAVFHKGGQVFLLLNRNEIAAFKPFLARTCENGAPFKERRWQNLYPKV